MRCRRMLLAACIALGTLAAAPQAGAAGAATAPCNPSAAVPLNVAAAAATPMLGATKAAPLGAAKARALLAGLAPANPCAAAATPRVAAALAAVESAAAHGDLPRAKRLLAAVLASIRARRTTAGVALVAAPRTAMSRSVKLRSAKKCPIDRAPKVSPKDADKVGDYLKAAQTAQKIKDQAASDTALGGARQAYGDWAGKQLGAGGGAKTVGDFVTIARGGLALGNDAAANAALARAATAAGADVTKAAAFDKCTATRDDVACLTAALAVAQALGGDTGDAAAQLAEANQAVGDRLAGKSPEGCEEWSFTMRMKATGSEDGSTWTIVWGAGKFRVSRKSGEIDGSQLAGYGAGWPGIVGDMHGRCIETTDEGKIDHGPATITGGPFHYAIGGTVTADGFSLEISSDDAKATMDAPGDLGCQFLRGLSDLILDPFVRGPLPLDIPVAEGQTTVTMSESGDGFEFSLTLQRISS